MNHVKELKELIARDPDVGTATRVSAVEHLIELLLIREQEFDAPKPPRGSPGYYFGRKDSSAQAKEALYDALPELLRTWVKMKESGDALKTYNDMPIG